MPLSARDTEKNHNVSDPDEAEYQALLNELKRCRRCGESKTVLEFAFNKRRREGLSSWCQDCHNERTREWRAQKRRQADDQAREAYRAAVAALQRQAEAQRRRTERQLEREHGVNLGRRQAR